MKRMVKVEFRNTEGTPVVEHYGPFQSNQHLAAWLDVQDTNVTFGNHFVMELQMLGDVAVPPPRVSRAKVGTR
jgi:hypothetical protein